MFFFKAHEEVGSIQERKNTNLKISHTNNIFLSGFKLNGECATYLPSVKTERSVMKASVDVLEEKLAFLPLHNCQSNCKGFLEQNKAQKTYHVVAMELAQVGSQYFQTVTRKHG